MNNSTPKNPMSEVERLELASKLDQELDEFINTLPKRQQEAPIPFDRWEEEIANHPFFMKEAPEPGDQLHPLYEGLQKLKYDPDENEPEELATAYKDDGNFNFKHKKYRMAIISYTEGINIKCGNVDIDASLSSLIDAEAALKLKPDYDKVLVRAANCCFKVENYEKAVEFCDRILERNKDDKETLALRKNSINQAKIKERDRRRRAVAANKLKKEEETIVEEIIKRGIKIEGGRENLTLSKLEPQFPELFNSRVSIGGNGGLVWPVILFYPEYKIMDYIQQFDEQNTFMEQLLHVFSDYPEWDEEKKYKAEKLNVYFENGQRENVKVDVNQTLLEILKLDSYIVREGTPKFIVLVANSKVEKLFLESS
ncbi:TPR 11 domain containing protein [Asbolus verrucosus]|uniref:TPR 11 domain containing protein n=1 Tax=Asbolus verrucosus TaxID=1661398 RepID=A0A482VTI3_ASBVE|nr:TPR 11 domain containing protein [Asbolus verrucosus]